MIDRKQIQSRVKVHLLSGKSITHNECLKMFKGSRLAASIYRLRKDGLNITGTMHYEPDGTQYMRYKLEKKPLKKVRRRYS